MIDSIGWIATLLFAASYLCKSGTRMRWVQAMAGLVWITYGILLRSTPLIFANLIVTALAGYSAWRDNPARRRQQPLS